MQPMQAQGPVTPMRNACRACGFPVGDQKPVLQCANMVAPEVQLLHATFSGSTCSNTGDFATVLSSSISQRWLQPRDEHLSVPEYFDAVEKQARLHQSIAENWQQLQVAVAAFLTFTQANLTGPAPTVPESPARLYSQPEAAQDANGLHTPGSALGQDAASPGDRWAAQQLSVDGEEVLGKVQLPQYLLLSRILLTARLDLSFSHQRHSADDEEASSSSRDALEALSDLPTWAWWTARVLLMNQRLLARSAASLRSALTMLMPQVVKSFGSSSVLELGESKAALAAAAELEAALVEHVYSSPQTALGHLQAAGNALGMHTIVEGAMGMRTVHQVDPKAQLIVSTSHSHEENGYTSGEDSSELDSMSLGSQVESSELKGLTTESDVLSAPKLVDGSGRVLDRPLGGLEQAVLLGWAQQVKKGTSADELQITSSKFPNLYPLLASVMQPVVSPTKFLLPDTQEDRDNALRKVVDAYRIWPKPHPQGL